MARTEYQLEKVLDAAGFGIWEYDHISGRSYWNTTLGKLLHIPPEQISRLEDWLDRIYPEDRPRVEMHMADTLSGTAPPETGLQERLAAIEGLDVAQGLTVMRNKFDLYARLLSMFVAGHADDACRLQAMVETGDLGAMEHLVHELKGIAGNLGASKVRALADAALKDLRQQAPTALMQVVTLSAALNGNA